jgi:hypothetical protein
MLILNFTYPLRCLRVPPVEYHWFKACMFLDRSNTVVVGSNPASGKNFTTILKGVYGFRS